MVGCEQVATAKADGYTLVAMSCDLPLNRALGVNDQTAAADADKAEADAPGNQPADQPANPEPESGKPRSHVFTYKVTESGSVPGVTNDAAATKTVSFKVTDDGNGKLTVERQGDAATPAFSFANTYTVEPASSSVTDQVTVTKTLTGRDMAAGEFRR